MTNTRIQDALLDVRDAVEVPALDEVAFHQHLRRARRGRVAQRSLVAAAAVLAVGVAPVIWHARPAGSPSPATHPTAPAVATSPQMFPVSLERRLQTIRPDGSGYSTRQHVEDVLGAGPAGIVVIAADSHLLLVPLMSSGQPAAPRDLGDGQPVQQAWLDKSGEYVGFVDLANQLHLRAVGSATDIASSRIASREGLLALDGAHWLTGRAGRVTLHTRSDSVVLAAGEAASSAEVAGPTVAYETRDGVDFFNSADGDHRASTSDISIGSLSPDGTRYVGSAGEQERDAGASAAWYLVDPRTGERHVFEGRPAGAVALALTWQDDERFLVLATDARQPGNRIAWDCSVATEQCVERYDDPGDTLQIPSR